MTLKELETMNREVDRHQGDCRAWLERHLNACRLATPFGPEGLRILQPSLFRRASDDRNLFLAACWVAETSGRTPGPDGQTWPRKVAKHEVFRFARSLRDELREGSYRHGDTRPIRIAKKSGRGWRRIEVPSLDDRVVQRAVVQVLQPATEILLTDTVFGFRLRLGRFDALARAERLMEQDAQTVVSVDIKDAFGSVPQRRLLDLINLYFGEPKLVDLISRIVLHGSGTGLRQGGALSPLLLNLYAHHFLDLPWRKKCRRPLLRYADDLAVFCNSTEEAEAMLTAVVQLLRPAGLRLRDDQLPIHHLGDETVFTWLGFDIRWTIDGMNVRVSENSWDTLSLKATQVLKRWHPSEPRLSRLLLGWIRENGPAWGGEVHRCWLERLERTLASAGASRGPSIAPAREAWYWSFIRWAQLRRRYRPHEEW